MIRLFVAFCLLMAGTARAEEIVLGLSQDQVSITANFTGSDILIFGAIKRDAPEPTDQGALGVIITVSGPQVPLNVWRKDRRLGIWVNSEHIEVDAAPSYYAVASSAPLSDVLKDVEDLRYSVSIPRAIRAVGIGIAGGETFIEALVRIRKHEGLYLVLEGAVDLEEDTLFRTSISMPSKLVEGDYAARIFLTRNGLVIDQYDTIIPVYKVGLERWLYQLAHNKPFVYGLMSLLIAVASGWIASAAFASLRR
jgi:uncharacterized protein (TIGR02186 family)